MFLAVAGFGASMGIERRRTLGKETRAGLSAGHVAGAEAKRDCPQWTRAAGTGKTSIYTRHDAFAHTGQLRLQLVVGQVQQACWPEAVGTHADVEKEDGTMRQKKPGSTTSDEEASS